MDELNIGSRLELFIDDYLINSMDHVELRLHHPVEREVALAFDEPWEGETSGYFTVLKDGPRYRMYYRGSNHTVNCVEIPDFHETVCTAESLDGIHWVKPELGICEFECSKKNNIVHTGEGSHAFVPFIDSNPEAKPDELYKAATSADFDTKPVLRAYVSADGYNWRALSDEPILTEGAFDSQNVVFWDSVAGEYVAYYREFRDGSREVKYSKSKDFIHWTDDEWISITGAPHCQLYTNAVQPYFRAPHIYLGFPKRFFEERKAVGSHPFTGVSDGGFMSSRDRTNFHIWGEAFVRPGQEQFNWTERSNMAAWGMLQLCPEEISMFYSRHFHHSTNHLSRMTLRTDGFVSVHAGAQTGNLTTKPLIFEGRNLVINYATSAGSGIRVELLDENNKPIPGYELDNCPVIYGDEIEHVVSWKSGSDVSALGGKPIRIRFELMDADLYAMQFRV